MRKIWSVVLVGIITMLVGISAYLFGQNQGIKKIELKDSQTFQNISTTPVITQLPIPTSIASSGVSKQKPVVFIESESNLPVQDVQELKARIIDPFIDYTLENGGENTLVSVKISQYQGEIKSEYPYMLDGIYSKGGNIGFLIKKTAGHIDWFVPDCMNGCNLSAEYKAKYPEVAKLAQ